MEGLIYQNGFSYVHKLVKSKQTWYGMLTPKNMGTKFHPPLGHVTWRHCLSWQQKNILVSKLKNCCTIGKCLKNWGKNMMHFWPSFVNISRYILIFRYKVVTSLSLSFYKLFQMVQIFFNFETKNFFVAMVTNDVTSRDPGLGKILQPMFFLNLEGSGHHV